MTIEELIRDLKEPDIYRRESISVKGMEPMHFGCTFSEVGASADEIKSATEKCPTDLYEFWNITSSAKLFEDKTYGQWGLDILEPKEAAKATRTEKSDRPKDISDDDLIVGRFLGDSDLLLIRCDDSAPDFGNVIVALPIDPREDWYTAASSLREFLQQYADALGEKYWEQ